MQMPKSICEPYHGPGKSILVLPRDELCRRQINQPHVLISIHDPEIGPAKLSNNPYRRGVLWLAFHDIQLPSPGRLHMTEEDGRKVVEIVKKHTDVSMVIINCMAGYSRSPGVAAGLSVWLNNEDRFFTQHYRPNAWCKLMVLKAVNRMLGLK